jgi:hypothetical protein
MAEIEDMLLAVARLQLALRLRPRSLARVQLITEVAESYRRSAEAARETSDQLEQAIRGRS